MKKAEQNDIQKLSFETAMAELESIVRKMEGGGQDLENSIQEYTRAVQLKSHCEKKLEEARLKVEAIVQQNGQLATAPFDAENA